MRGEFVRGDGLVLTNNVTILGEKGLLEAAFQGVDTRFVMVLANTVFAPDLTQVQLQEPTVTPGGYQRTQLLRDTTDWPVVTELNGEYYVESRPVIFPAAAYDRPVSRVAIVDDSEGPDNLIPLMLSSPFPIRTIGVATPESERTFSYRLYLR